MEDLCEGFFIETSENLIFHVKGFNHPSDGFISFLRYIPSKSGSRERNGEKFKKIYSMNEKFSFLEENYPKYVKFSEKINKKIQFVKSSEIKRIYNPKEKLKKIIENKPDNPLKLKTLDFVEELLEQGVNIENLGITGSILTELHTQNSDIDLIGYGFEEGKKIYSALDKLRKKESKISPYNRQGAEKIAKFRWKNSPLDLKAFLSIEKNKILHGKFENKDYFFRLARQPKESEYEFENTSFRRIGTAKIRGRIKDDKYSIFTPNKYPIDCKKIENQENLEIENIFSYRGKFTEQAKKNEEILAEGRLEKINYENGTKTRMILGKPKEYMIPINDKTKKHL